MGAARAKADGNEYDLRKAWAILHRLWLLSRRHPEAREQWWAAVFTAESHLKAVRARYGRRSA
jgi:hypothetical protein